VQMGQKHEAEQKQYVITLFIHKQCIFLVPHKDTFILEICFVPHKMYEIKYHQVSPTK